MSMLAKNTVKAEKQLGTKDCITFEHENGEGIRVLFVGNSITRHAPKSEIGWENDWGMAASSKEKDYVHLLQKQMLQKAPQASFCVCQTADWERCYQEGEKQLSQFEKARNFRADLIIMRLIENCAVQNFDATCFQKEYEKLYTYFNPTGTAKVIITSSFWKHPGDEALEMLSKEKNLDYVFLGDLGEQAEMRADGLFAHEGVAMHPGDLGMETIALRIFQKAEQYLS